MARLPFATRLVMSLDKASVRWTGSSFFMKLFAAQKGIDLDPDFKPATPLLLITTGRKSGRARSVVLTFFSFEGQTFVVGSKGGAPEDPDWVHNLRKSPAATVYIHRRPKPVTLRIASPAERARLWPKLVALAPTYDGYQRGTQREIPLVIIE